MKKFSIYEGKVAREFLFTFCSIIFGIFKYIFWYTLKSLFLFSPNSQQVFVMGLFARRGRDNNNDDGI